MVSINYLLKRLKNMNFQSMKDTIYRVHLKTNRLKLFIFLDMVWCGIVYGAGYVDYEVIGFYKLNHKQRASMLTRGKNNTFVKKLNEKEYWSIFDHKNEFNEKFSDFIQREWLYPISKKREEALSFFEKHAVFFAKPNDGQCGKGIEKIQTKDWDNVEDLYAHLVENHLELVEEPIKQHTAMNTLNSSSVNTVRVVTVMNQQKKVTILAAFVRIGNGKVVDNFNSGGMTAKVDIETGRICEEAVNKKGEVFACHPLTGTKIKDFLIPNWKEAKEMVCKAAKQSTHVRYIGWDVAITQSSATLVEGNQFPGHDIYQVAEKIKAGDLGVLPQFKEAMQEK